VPRFLVQRLKRIGGAPANSRNVAELSGRMLVAHYHYFRRISVRRQVSKVPTTNMSDCFNRPEM
jgi:hypothetical protein